MGGAPAKAASPDDLFGRERGPEFREAIKN